MKLINRKSIIVTTLIVFILSAGATAAFLLWPNDPQKDLMGEWQTELNGSDIKLDFSEEKLTITSYSNTQGINLSHNLEMDYDVEKEKDTYIVNTDGHQITSQIDLNEEEIFSQYPDEYLKTLSEEDRQEYMDKLKEKLLSIEESFKESVSENPKLEVELDDKKENLEMKASVLEEDQILLEKTADSK